MIFACSFMRTCFRQYAPVRVVAFLLCGVLASCATVPHPNQDDYFAVIETVETDELTGAPVWLDGEFGTLILEDLPAAAIEYLGSVAPAFGLADADEFDVYSYARDELGITHIRLQQYHSGVIVDGGEISLHVDSAGVVRTINAHVGSDIQVSATPSVPMSSVEMYIEEYTSFEIDEILDGPQLVYFVRPATAISLAWRTDLRWHDGERPIDMRVYLDAMTGHLLRQVDLQRTALYREIRSGALDGSGPLLCKEGDTCSDPIAADSYENLGEVYDYYMRVFELDSWDGIGGTVKAVVHANGYVNNAGWSDQHKLVVFGDGDGTKFAPFGHALDIVAHEYTHGVSFFAIGEDVGGFEYYGESGAIDEGFADILAAGSERYAGHSGDKYWIHGEDVIIAKACPEEAERFFANPFQNGNSRDYYPSRFTGDFDSQGVHINNGIPMLAFYLMVNGGRHPSWLNTSHTIVGSGVSGPGMGFDKAEQIFYRAYNYLLSKSTFKDLRLATAKAADDLYGAATKQVVHDAWDAVGVRGTPRYNELFDEEPVANLSGDSGSWREYIIRVPVGQKSLTVKTSKGTGDCNLYVRNGVTPVNWLATHDDKSTNTGNNDSVTIPNPASGDWFIAIHGFTDYAGVELVADYDHGAGMLIQEYEGSSGNGSKDRAVDLTMIENTARAIGYVADRPCDEIDVDFYQIYLDPSEELTIHMTMPTGLTRPGGTVDYNIELLDQAGDILAEGNNPYGQDESVSWLNASPWQYKIVYVKVYGKVHANGVSEKTNEKPYLLDLVYGPPSQPFADESSYTDLSHCCWTTGTACPTGAEGSSLYQSFRPSFTKLAGVSVVVRTGPNFPVAGKDFELRVLPGLDDSPLVSQKVHISSANSYDETMFMFSTPVTVLTDKTYYIELVMPGECGSVLHWCMSDESYTQGSSFNWKKEIYPAPSKDFCFTTYAVP